MKQEGQFSKNNNLLQYAIQLVCEMKQEGQFSKNNNLLQYAIQLVCILKWNKRDSFQKTTNLLQYAIQLVCILKWNKRGCFSKRNKNFQKTTIYYIMLFNMLLNLREKKQEGQFSKNNNLLQYAIQPVCVLKWNKRGSFQKTTIYYMYAIQLVSVLKWNKRDSFQKKTTIYYSMLFNLCAYWNETRGVVFKKIQLMTICYWTHVRNETRGAVFKKQQFITVCYSTCVHIEMKQEGQFSRGAKKQQFITVCYSTCVRIEMKQEGQFSKKKTIYYSMLFNLCAYWNETRGTVFKKKHQFITVCYSTCVHIEMKQDGQFSKKSN